jgi:hypothetical protein
VKNPFLHPSSPFEINTTVTQPQPQKEKGEEEKKGEETTVPGPIQPEPSNPEPNQPLTAPEVSCAESLLLPETTEAKPMPVAKPEKTEAKPVVNPEKTEAKPMPVANPETTEVKPMPASEEHVQKIARLVLSYFEDFWSCKKIPGELFRQYVAKISGRYENAVWELLFPAHVVKLHTTDFFILRDDKHRPKGYEGLLEDKGILPIDEPALF